MVQHTQYCNDDSIPKQHTQCCNCDIRVSSLPEQSLIDVAGSGLDLLPMWEDETMLVLKVPFDKGGSEIYESSAV